MNRRGERFRERISRKEERKVKGRRDKQHLLWFGLGMFGVVGWMVMIPTIIGVAVGIWLDTRFGGRIIWTLMTALIGLIIGCLNAWIWIARERDTIEKEREDE